MIKKNPPQSFFKTCGLTPRLILRIAYDTGFCKRASGKIDVPDLLRYFCEESIKGTVSHNDLAAKIQAETGVSVSRQACWERINDTACVDFFKAILEKVMLSKIDSHEGHLLKHGNIFQRILIQDSTIIQLPVRLFEVFSGIKNGHAASCNARIQGIYDLCSGKFIQFSIDPYSKNDLSVAADIPVKPGDLILRDRGYFLLEAIAAFKKEGTDTISRYKHNTTFYDLQTKEKINLLALLQRLGTVDTLVLAGANKDIRLRLLAAPVPEEVANLRRMKAKKEMHSTPSEELLQLMGWSIFITTIENPIITFKYVLALYGLRWRIENIFKTWKSNFSFTKLHNVSVRQLHVLLTARLMMISIFYHKAYGPLSLEILSLSNKQLSLMKFMRYIWQNLALLTKLLNPHLWNTPLLLALSRYCTYEKRKRPHFMTNVDDIISELSRIYPLA